MSDLKMNVQLVQFECQSVPKMSGIHLWPKMNVSEVNFFMMCPQPVITDQSEVACAFGGKISDLTKFTYDIQYVIAKKWQRRTLK